MSNDRQNGQRRHGRSKVTHRAAAAAQSLKSLERWSHSPPTNYHATAESATRARAVGGDDLPRDLSTQMADAKVPPPPTA